MFSRVPRALDSKLEGERRSRRLAGPGLLLVTGSPAK